MINSDNENYKVENLLEGEGLLKKIGELKKEGKKIGLCSGSFDLLHPGHITHLSSAKDLCDVLVVAVARDKWSKKVKSRRGRPIFSERARAYSLSKLRPVDFVVYNHDEYATIKSVRPDYYIKGRDYQGGGDENFNKIRKFVESFGGKVVFTTDEKLSTTQIIDYVKKEID